MNEDTSPAEPRRGVEKFGAHRKALELFDLTVQDMTPLAGKALTMRLVSQQIASADSIAANIEEGYGRGSKKDYAHFLAIARGSAHETAGRDLRMKHWLPAEVVLSRKSLCQEIIAILSATIIKLRTDS